jgi:hypothetical protein
MSLPSNLPNSSRAASSFKRPAFDPLRGQLLLFRARPLPGGKKHNQFWQGLVRVINRTLAQALAVQNDALDHALGFAMPDPTTRAAHATEPIDPNKNWVSFRIFHQHFGGHFSARGGGELGDAARQLTHWLAR